MDILNIVFLLNYFVYIVYNGNVIFNFILFLKIILIRTK
jgi:hypothetical protein